MSKIRKIAYVASGVAAVTLMGMVGFSAGEARAACGYGVRADFLDGEYNFFAACDRGESEDGKIKVNVETVDGAEALKITLNNYVGGRIYWECCATCSDVNWEKVVFELHGENVITEENGIGINFRNAEFAGEGNLTVKAMIPIAGGGWDGSFYACTGNEGTLQIEGVDVEALSKTLGVTTLRIMPGGDVVTDGEDGTDGESKIEEDSDEVNDNVSCIEAGEDDHSGLIWQIIAGAYIGVSLIAFAIIGVRYFMKKKMAKVPTVETKTENEEKK